MRCHKCNQDSIKIDNGHIVCDICGLDINISLNLEEDHFFDLFFYNKNLDEAEKLGCEAMLDNKVLEDNPYTIAADQIMLNKKWEEGYKKEQLSYEFSALSLSSEKIENQLKTEIKILKEEKEALEEKINKFIPDNCRYIQHFCSDLMRKKILGTFLKKEVGAFFEKYKTFHRSSMGTWKYPD